MSDRVILHCDCNSFFASVETVFHPEYKNQPMAVCGSTDNRHGIVLAKNELAKAYGIKTAETVYSAKKKCPSLVIAQPHHSLYLEFSRRVGEIYARFTDQIEPFGIDESWLDVTASRKLFGSGEEIAKKISEAVKSEIGITISVGVSFNKVYAKLGSDYKKPDAITVIDRNNYKSIVFPLPVSDLLFVGKRTADTLVSLGIRTIGDLATASPHLLNKKLGKMGDILIAYAAGEDKSPVSCDECDEVKSVSNSITFRHDLTTEDEIKIGIEFLSDKVATRLRRKSLLCSGVQITVKDVSLKSIQRQCVLDIPTDIGSEIKDAAFRLLRSNWRIGAPIRMLSVGAINLSSLSDTATQLSLFETDETKREKIRNGEKVIDTIRQKYGSAVIIKGAELSSDIGIASTPIENEDQ